MIYLLLVSLAVLFILCYLFSGRDFFTPSTVQILTFAGATFMCIYFMWSLDCPHDFHWETIAMIAGAMAMSAIIGSVVHQLFVKLDIKPHTQQSVDSSPISDVVSLLVIGIILFTIFWLLIEINRIGGTSSFAISMYRFHALHSYSTDENGRLPWLLKQLIDSTYVIFVLYSFNLMSFYNSSVRRVGERIVHWFIMGLCSLVVLLTSSRGQFIKFAISFIIMSHMLQIRKNNGYKQYSLKKIFRVGIFVFFVLMLFVLTKGFVGRNSRNETLNAVDYVSYYAGSGIIAFDKYIQRPLAPSGFWGKETFYNLHRFLSIHGFSDIPQYIIHKEFRPVGAGFSNNVYTFLRSYHYDFGVIGMYLLHSFSIIFLSAFYEYVKKKRGDIGILVFSMIYYSVVLSCFTEYFYQNLFSLNYGKRLILLLILYELLIRKRIRLKFCRTVHVSQPIPIQQESHTTDS